MNDYLIIKPAPVHSMFESTQDFNEKEHQLFHFLEKPSFNEMAVLNLNNYSSDQQWFNKKYWEKINQLSWSWMGLSWIFLYWYFDFNLFYFLQTFNVLLISLWIEKIIYKKFGVEGFWDENNLK